MFDRLTRSYHLLRQSLAVLLQDSELLIFPLLSAVAFVGVGAAFVVPAIVDGAQRAVWIHSALNPLHLAVVFGFYVASYFVVAFFNVALMACAGIRLSGGDPTLADGFKAATARAGSIFSWVLLAATVGTALHLIQQRANGFLGRLLSGALGMAWSVATALAVPVLAFENLGPIESLKRSMELMKRTWGEELVGNLGLGLVTSAGMLAAFGVGGFGMLLAPHLWVAWAAAAVGILGFAAIVQSALHGIFQAAVYAYATSGQVPAAFSASLVSGAYGSR